MDLARAPRYALACGLAMAAQALLAAVEERTVTTPVAVAQLAIAFMPGPAATAIIGLLHEWATRLAIGSAVAGVLLAGAVAGWTRRPLLALVPWTAGPLGALAIPQLGSDAAATLIPAAVGAAVTWATVGAGSAARRSASRRRLLLGAGALATAGMLASAGTRAVRVLRARVVAGGTLPALASLRAAAPADPAEDPRLVRTAPELVADITPNADFYVVDEAIVKPVVDAERWRLGVGGNVRVAFALGYDDLLALPAVEQHQTLECISNPVGGPLISTTTWIGVPVRMLLERAGLLEGTRKILFRSVEGYSSALPLEVAMDPSTLVAYGMGGTTLPREHGFPARLLIPGRYGMKNVKWLTAVEAVTDDRLGYWERRGWSDEAIVHTMARIDTPPSQMLLRAGKTVVVAGIAYAGARGVSGVEVATDDRKTWNAAQLGRRLSAQAWRRWAFAWDPPGPGWYRIAVRATDDRGVLQVEDEQDPLPMGATGIHSYQIQAR